MFAAPHPKVADQVMANTNDGKNKKSSGSSICPRGSPHCSFSHGSSSSACAGCHHERLAQAGETDRNSEKRNSADVVSKASAVEFKQFTDAKDFASREALGPLHLRAFDTWAAEIKKHMESDQLLNPTESASSQISLLEQWLKHCEQIKIRGMENEVRVFRKAKAHKKTRMKMEVGILPGSVSEQLFTRVIDPFMLARGCRRMAGTEPRGDNARIVQEFLDEQDL